MNKKTIKFLKISFLSAIIICILVFVWLVLFMSSKTEDTIIQVSNIYMSEINKQVQQKFSSLLRIRITQINGVYDRTPPDSNISREDIVKELKISAEVREFSSLGFLSEDGQMESVYGEKVSIDNPDDILTKLKQYGDFVTQGHNEKGETFLVFGTDADYEMEDGKKSVLLMAGIPMNSLNSALFLETDDSEMYFHIIDGDGNFIIKNASISEENYFDHVLSESEQDKDDESNSQLVLEKLKDKMKIHEDYSSFLHCFGEEKYIYCSPISEKVDWYLVAIMPQGKLSQSIRELDILRTQVIIGSILIIVLSMLIMFISYYKISRQQMRALDKAKEEAIRANMAKSEFLSSMSHDIRTPMNAIIGMTEIALKNVQKPEQMTEYLKKIKLSSGHLLGLINDVLDMSKIESGKLELHEHPMSLRDTMSDIVNIVQSQIKEKNQPFDIFIHDIISENIICDNIRLNQVLINLVSNAVKFTPEEGRIDIYVYQESSPKGEEYVRTHFRVKDSGIGMSKEFQKKIFETFSREETVQVQQITGTGLGMPITKSIVELMGGSIELQSELNKGSEFHVTIDFKKAEINNNDMKLPTWNILVVDDDEQLCSSVVANLEELGTHPEWTTDGHKAVEMIEEHHVNHEDYNFILIDWKMPGLDGIQTMHEIRKRWKQEIPIFLISAYDLSDVEDQVDLSLLDGFISKPLFKSTLFEKLSQYLVGHTEKDEQEDETKIDFLGKRILLAEDIDINWEVAYEMLSLTGLELERAVNGKDCVEKFENSELGFYDAILMDIRMPVMNGYDATKTIRKLERADKDLPIIAMTADAFSDDVQFCLDCGMNGHLSKPIDIRECMRVLQKFLG